MFFFFYFSSLTFTTLSSLDTCADGADTLDDAGDTIVMTRDRLPQSLLYRKSTSFSVFFGRSIDNRYETRTNNTGFSIYSSFNFRPRETLKTLGTTFRAIVKSWSIVEVFVMLRKYRMKLFE